MQPEEQHGFREDFSCNDLVHSLRMLAEKAEECEYMASWDASCEKHSARSLVF